MEALVGYSDSDWNFVKLHMLSHYSDAIRWFGNVGGYQTGPWESLHRWWCKKAYAATNKREAGMLLQVRWSGLVLT